MHPLIETLKAIGLKIIIGLHRLWLIATIYKLQLSLSLWLYFWFFNIRFITVVILNSIIFTITFLLSDDGVAIKFLQEQQSLGHLLGVVTIDSGLLLQGVANEDKILQTRTL